MGSPVVLMQIFHCIIGLGDASISYITMNHPSIVYYLAHSTKRLSACFPLHFTTDIACEHIIHMHTCSRVKRLSNVFGVYALKSGDLRIK